MFLWFICNIYYELMF